MSDAQPLSFDQARVNLRQASLQQDNAEQFAQECRMEFAAKRQAYQMELARKMVTLKAEGIAWTVCPDLARGDEKVAKLRYQKDVAEGLYEAAKHAVYRKVQDRVDARLFAEWSKARELAEGLGPVPVGPLIGGRA